MKALLVLILVLLLSVSFSASQCSVDEDCSLNGQCTNGACVCDPWWTGSDCGVLNLLPAKKNTGYNRSDETVSSWGGKVVQDPSNKGLYHLFAAEFINNCGLGLWSPNSIVVRAVSNQPEGPYKFQEQLLGTFHHNPTVVWSPSDKLWLLVTIGCPTNQTANCKKGEPVGSPLLACDSGNSNNGESGISLWSSKSLLGPWTSAGTILSANAKGTWDCDSTNPSLYPLDNGTMMLMYRGCPYNCVGAELIGLSSAPHFQGPYTRRAAPLFPNPNEDPYIWQDSRGHWHALMHSLEAKGGFGSGPMVGRHAWSRTGLSWTFGAKTLAYSTLVKFTDGTTIDFYRRERPQLYFELGVPKFLINGVQEKGQSGSYTLIQPLAN